MFNISFIAPWALSALLILPLLWHLLKVTPPKPRVIKFPAVRLLQELKTEHLVTSKTPWWIILLRSLIVIFFILAMAQPIWNKTNAQTKPSAPLVVIIDNDWSVMDSWQQRIDEVQNILNIYEPTDQPILLAATADNSVLKFDRISVARSTLINLKARPWSTQRQKLLEKLTETISQANIFPKILLISNDLKENEDDNFIHQLNTLGELEIVRSGLSALPVVLQDIRRTEQGFKASLLHQNFDNKTSIALHLIDEQANILYRQTLTIKPSTNSTSTNLVFPTELKAKAIKLRLSTYQSPASQYLLDERWRDRPVGLIGAHQVDKTLLAPAYYVQKSLRPYAPIRNGSLDDLLKRDLALLVDSGYTKFTPQQTISLKNWISQGGVFIRFASANLAKDPVTELSPVQLLQGARTLGGTLSWKRPTTLAAFPEHSPFRDLSIPQDISIKKQVLAKPESNLSQKTWASLKDGTPLITAKPMGQGWSVLFHITPIPDWSNLPLSGMFEMMMVRLLTLSAGNDLSKNTQELLPYRIFDETGNLVPPLGKVTPLKANELKTKAPSALSPPGLYGHNTSLHAFNLGPSIEHIVPLTDIPHDIEQSSFHINNEISLAPWAFFMALLLTLIDWLLSITWLRLKATTATCALFIILLIAQANAETKTDWSKALEAANNMRLAYMVTGNAKLDDITKRGLNGLGIILRRRTAVELSPAMAFDPEKDDPSLFPMIYWPISDDQEELSDHAAKKLNGFLKTGGFILFDTMGKKRTRAMTRLSQKLNIGALRPVSNTHVLTRAFYLMQSFPGRFDHNEVWVEAAENSDRDRVSSVLIGSNAWAQAWARDDRLKPLYAVVPGGEVQREYSYRFGVNLVMYILSGNYKGDQVHLPAILQRLGL